MLSPASSVGEPDVKLLFKTIVLSAKLIVSELTVVVVPPTVRLPVMLMSSLTVTLPVPLPLNTRLVSVDLVVI